MKQWETCFRICCSNAFKFRCRWFGNCSLIRAAPAKIAAKPPMWAKNMAWVGSSQPLRTMLQRSRLYQQKASKDCSEIHPRRPSQLGPRPRLSPCGASASTLLYYIIPYYVILH